MRQEALARVTEDGPQPGELVAGKYRVDALLGRGGMGLVLSATNEATGKKVALKWILDPSEAASARFAREARAAGRIDHPNVVDVYDVVEHDGAACIVMELLRGESLASALARESRFEVEEAVAIAIEIGRGVAAAHEAGVIHRDLKPGNVFLCDVQGGPRVKIVDFGISKLVEAEPQPLTDTGVVLGTPQYLAPEQVRGVPDLDHRVDIYALGAVLYEMLTGRPPHHHDYVPALLVEIATVAPRPAHVVRPELPRALSDIVGRAIAKEPDGRFQTARELVAALAGNEPPSGEKRISTRVALDAPTLEVGVMSAAAPAMSTGDAPPKAAPAPVGPAPILGRIAVILTVAVLLGLAAFAGSRPAVEPDETVSPRAAPTSVALEAPLPEAPVSIVAAPIAPVAEAPSIDPPPRPRPSVRRAPEPTTEAAPIVEPIVTPVPAETPSTPAPRAGRLGLDDL